MKKVLINKDEIEVEYKLAPFWKVLGSSLIDVLTLLVYSLACGTVIGVLIMYWIFGLPFIYNKDEYGQGLLNSKSETWGHRLFKIKRISISKSSKISHGSEFLRFFGLMFMGVGFLSFFITKKRQSLHDLVSKSVVVDFNCQGTKIWSNGNKYVGDLKDGMMHGVGVFTFSDGEKTEGSWENDDFIENE